ncbi:hypothetical protein TorRG33x02_165900 [Trema orientale]|uniref:Secreted protein n=1 Tax=Trema orientale TaxID=63057 RepID=A0A2P5EPY2_TREOI|nr:hypothetical protein TorRG33x02_165900 [Trema orientale]
MPLVSLLLLFSGPLTADLEHSAVFHLDLHLFFLQPRKISFEHVCIRGLPPVDPSVGDGGCFPGGGGDIGHGGVERDALKGVPYVEREGVEHVASSATEETESHVKRVRFGFELKRLARVLDVFLREAFRDFASVVFLTSMR